MKTTAGTLVIVILATVYLTCYVISNDFFVEATVKTTVTCGGGVDCYKPRPPPCHKGKICPSPRPSPTLPPRNPTITLTPIPPIDVYPISTFGATCFGVLNTITSLNNLGAQNCHALVQCITWWIQHYLQFALRGLTTGASFPLTLTSDAGSLAWRRLNTLVGGTINDAGTSVLTTLPICSSTNFVLASNGLIYSTECAARALGVPAPYIPVTIDRTTSLPDFPNDISNPRVVLTRFYIEAALRYIRFLLAFLNDCLLSTDLRVLNASVTNLTQALSLLNQGDLNAAKNEVLTVTRTI
ncbi:hypothetical protein ABK040_008584 [Willaertia magna]